MKLRDIRECEALIKLYCDLHKDVYPETHITVENIKYTFYNMPAEMFIDAYNKVVDGWNAKRPDIGKYFQLDRLTISSKGELFGEEDDELTVAITKIKKEIGI